MSIDVAERLKSELTDKYVLVTKGVPELKRFEGLTGTVKTVNMNGRALVQFDGPEDISWYDIDPSYLKVVDAPLPKKAKEAPKAEAKAAPKAGAAKSTAGLSPLEAARAQGGGAAAAPAKPSGGTSPLEMARAQAAGGGGGEAPAKPAGDKPLSPLEAARQQGAGADSAADEPPAESSVTPAEKPAGDVDLSKLSPLERARLEGSGN